MSLNIKYVHSIAVKDLSNISLDGTKLLKSTDRQSYHSLLYECINIQKFLLSKQLDLLPSR